jgi:ribosomal protein S18 acetylase RimI-like enzyme
MNQNYIPEINKKFVINSTYIRNYNLDDVDIIAEKQEALINFHYKIDSNYYKASQHAKSELKEFLIKKLNDKNFKVLLAIYEDDIVGYVMGWITERPPIYCYRKVGYLSNIYIDERYRGKGLGTMLFNKLKKWFINKGVDFIELKADCKNEDTVKSFLTFGFSLRTFGFMIPVNKTFHK